MKFKLILLLCDVALLFACTKGDGPSNTAIKGNWELRATRNGNIIPATYPAGNGHILIFGDTTFYDYISGSKVAQGGYHRSSDPNFQFTVRSLSTIPFYSMANSTYNTNEVIIKGDTLLFLPIMPDISTEYYVRTNINPAQQ